MKFTDFNLPEPLLAGLRDVQFEEATPIQEKAIPVVTEGKDLIATAQTGTGKTGAFVVPIMERVLNSKREGVKALILSPTRELASQIDEQVFAIGYHTGITSATVIGGSDFSVQARALKAGVDIIVATPGRLMDQNKVVNIDFSNLEYFVLDEADRMLDMGFLPDIKKIISWLPEKRQNLLFSATMPDEIQELASRFMDNPVSIEIAPSKPSQLVEQRAYTLRSNQKIPLIKKIFKEIEWDSCIIFTSTKKGTNELYRLLKKEGIKAESIHGDRSQEERNRALAAFKNGEVPVIVATDVLARGIDIKGVSIILNYDVPNNTDDYVHRIGRTGRYDQSGIAVTFVTQRDSRVFGAIENIKDNKLKKIPLPESFGSKSRFSWNDDFEKQPAEPSSKNEGDKKSKGKESRDKKKSASAGGKKESGRSTSKSKESGSSGSRAGNKTSGRQRSSDQNIKSDKRSSSSSATSDKKEQIVLPPVIEKAVERNKNVWKPAKGFWGIVKSFIPKF